MIAKREKKTIRLQRLQSTRSI